MLRRLGQLAAGALSYVKIAWWGVVAPHTTEGEGLLLVQAAVFAVVDSEQRVLLGLRSDLRGWELPGGTVEPGETPEQALLRELREETGLDVAIDAYVADYVRTGFRPHRAMIFRCTVLGGQLRCGEETLELRFFDAEEPPAGLFPWYRGPLADVLAAQSASALPLQRRERWGLREIAAGLRIDLATRFGRTH